MKLKMNIRTTEKEDLNSIVEAGFAIPGCPIPFLEGLKNAAWSQNARGLWNGFSAKILAWLHTMKTKTLPATCFLQVHAADFSEIVKEPFLLLDAAGFRQL